MGFLSKIKENFEHGGVNVVLQAAQSVSRQDPTLPITVTITNNSAEARTVKHITAEVQATENNSSVGMALNNTVQMGNTTNDNEMYTMQTFIIAQTDSPETFVLQPKEAKTVTLTIGVNTGASSPTDGILGHLASLTSSLNQNRYRYELRASADVEGVTLDPHAHQTLQIV